MAKYYNYSVDICVKLYLSAAFHDLGKLAIPPHILEKEGALTDEEFEIIKSHVLWTHNLLSEIKGFEEICYIAAAHHEKLDGTGYPHKKNADELDFNSRLLACIDIYQAVCEERPYHAARSHQETMPILYDMADKGKLDIRIVKDMDEVMAEYSLRDLPPPPL